MELKDSLTVALIQSDLFWEDVPANLASFEEKLANLPVGVDLVILPEMFSTGFSMEPEKTAEVLNLATTRWMQQVAAHTGAMIIGSFISKDQHRYFNRLMAVSPDGSYQYYDKRHLFRMAEEHKVYTGGTQKLILNWKGWRICPLVCYDLRFPVWSRRTISEPYDLLIYVANWPAARTYAWNTLLRARAIENQTYVAGVNRVGADNKGIEHSGGSLLVDYTGQVIKTAAGNIEEIVISEISLSQLNDFRERFPAFLDSDEFEIKF